MKMKKMTQKMLAVLLASSTILTGCGGTTTEAESSPAESDAGTVETSEAQGGGSESSNQELMTIEIYDVAANYQGVQTGWFGKVLKDKFNIELNIIAPNIAGDSAALYQTRCSSGNLGDIVILDNSDFIDCVEAGLIKDISADLPEYNNLSEYMNQINAFNDTIQMEGTYGIPCQMTNTSSDTYSEELVYTSPMVPWDYYTELGSPDLETADDLLQLLADMQAAHPTNAEGDKAYALSLWSAWDSDMGISNVVETLKWYGEQLNGSVLLSADGSMKSLTDDNGAYYKALHFLFKANQMGLVDPDSGTQDWDTTYNKMVNKRVYLFWYNWQRNYWNTIERAEKGDAYINIPVAEMNFFQNSDPYYGDGRVWGVGSQVDEEKEKRIMELLDWLASPEGIVYQQCGLKDFNYTVNEDGTFTRINENALAENLEVPEEYGGGGYSDGSNAINQWIVAGISTNPENGEPYLPDYWSSTIEQNQTKVTREWQEKFGAENQVAYLTEHNMISIVPKVNIVLESDSTDIAVLRSECGKLVNNYSWQMIFASDEADFQAQWEDLKTQLNGLGWDDLVAFDKEKYQKVVDLW